MVVHISGKQQNRGEDLKNIKRSFQVKLLQDKGMERWLQRDADKIYGFTHVFAPLR